MRMIVVSMPRCLQHFPERLSLPQELDAPAGDRELPLAYRNRAAGTLGPRCGQVRHHRFRIAVDEIENAVATWIQTGDERGPCHGTLRRDCGFQWGETAGRGKAREIREPALVDERSREVVIQTVEAQDDDPFACGGGSPAATR